MIKGWDQGLLDMCVSEKRKLTIPPEFGYGACWIVIQRVERELTTRRQRTPARHPPQLHVGVRGGALGHQEPTCRRAVGWIGGRKKTLHTWTNVTTDACMCASEQPGMGGYCTASDMTALATWARRGAMNRFGAVIVPASSRLYKLPCCIWPPLSVTVSRPNSVYVPS